jgi:hypothetical protein
VGASGGEEAGAGGERVATGVPGADAGPDEPDAVETDADETDVGETEADETEVGEAGEPGGGPGTPDGGTGGKG